jgi:MraZ protein
LFLGTYEHTVDAKGRLAVPARFRDLLGEGAVVTRGAERCLVIYPEPAWTSLRSSIDNLPMSDPNARAFRRFMFAEAATIELDGQGRILLPARLREYAGIERAAVVVGMDRTVEIWSESGWAAVQADLDARAGEIVDRLDSII